VKLSTRLTAITTLVVLSLSVAGVAYASTWTVALHASSHAEAHAQASPAAPTGVTATCVAPASKKEVSVTWSAVSHASEFEVLQSLNGGSYGLVTTLTATAWSSGAGLATGTYNYEVETQIGTNWASSPSSPSATRTISNNACS
jgi:hypothetical protein